MRHIIAVSIVSALLAAATACDPPTRENQECISTVDVNTAVSPSANTVRARGTIAENESVLVRYTSGANVNTVVGVQSGADIVFNPLPSGNVTLVFLVSCDEADQKEYPPITRTIS